jgi:hypothetical protein
LWPGKPPHRLHGVPQGEDQELHLLRLVAAEEVEPAKTGYLLELRANGIQQVPRIGFLLGERAEPAPSAYDHGLYERRRVSLTKCASAAGP